MIFDVGYCPISDVHGLAPALTRVDCRFRKSGAWRMCESCTGISSSQDISNFRPTIQATIAASIFGRREKTSAHIHGSPLMVGMPVAVPLTRNHVALSRVDAGNGHWQTAVHRPPSLLKRSLGMHFQVLLSALVNQTNS